MASALIDGALECGIALPLALPQALFDVRSDVVCRGEGVDARIAALAGMGNLIGAGIRVTPFSCRMESRRVDAGASRALDTRSSASSSGTLSSIVSSSLSGALITQLAAADLVASIAQTLSSFATSYGDSRVRKFAGSVWSSALSAAVVDMRARGDTVDGDGDDVASVSASAALEGGSMLASLLAKLLPQTRKTRSHAQKVKCVRVTRVSLLSAQ